jgi:hypothetical protein
MDVIGVEVGVANDWSKLKVETPSPKMMVFATEGDDNPNFGNNATGREITYVQS